jgi:carbon-monoxide dehydrogenase medium subunit
MVCNGPLKKRPQRDGPSGSSAAAFGLLRGKEPSEELFQQAAEIASADCSPGADGRGPIDYKRHLAGVLTHRALRRAATRALQGEV